MEPTIYFKSRSRRYSEFSNFYQYSFELDGKEWKSVEHYYQAQKFAGTELEGIIWDLKRPVKTKQWANKNSDRIRKDWDNVKFNIMKKALIAKFTQNAWLGRLLMSTKAAELVHLSATDKYWGGSREGSGDNRLGYLLMDLRRELSTGSVSNNG
nr:NADAR family protein [uncultured Desulfobacter sp.]